MEKLYNGIEIPAAWPPRNMDDHSLRDLPVPYLTKPPKVIDISVGRQLFVDDFLIDETTMEKRFHQAVFSTDSPVWLHRLRMAAGLIRWMDCINYGIMPAGWKQLGLR